MSGSRLTILVFAIVWPVLGLALSLALAALDGGEATARMAGYAVGLLPFSVLVGGVANRLWRRATNPGPTWPALPVALIASLLVAQILATIRFRLSGATGGIALSALFSTSEILMVGSVLPTLLALGAAVARDRGGRGIAPLLGRVALAAGATVLLLGPALIGVALLGRTGVLNPLALAAIVLVFVDRFDRRWARP